MATIIDVIGAGARIINQIAGGPIGNSGPVGIEQQM
jgi:hypothetical protein